MTWICGLTCLTVLALFIALGNRRIFESRPVVDAHRSFENQCSLCHQTRFHLVSSVVKPTRRFAEACGGCHVQSMDDHPRRGLPFYRTPFAEAPDAGVKDCSSCHKEHRGRRSLSEIGDAQCTTCHRDLTAARVGRVDSPHVHPRISSFAAHPELALRRAAAVGARHSAHRVAIHDGQRWYDRSGLRFSHRFHLASEGVPIPTNHPDYRPGRKLKKLTCTDCHRADAAGAYMLPIAFEQHCRSCHQLDVYRPITLIGGQHRPLPHQQSDILLGVIQQRLLESSGLRFPQLLEAPADNSARKIEGDLKVELAKVPFDSDIKLRCRRCHEISPREGRVSWRVNPPAVPVRWLHHSRFRHDAHLSLSCGDCHYLDPKGESGSAVADSDSASDILLPSIDTCKKCHVADAGVLGGSSARSRCVSCHKYHSPHHAAVRVNRLRPAERLQLD